MKAPIAEEFADKITATLFAVASGGYAIAKFGEITEEAVEDIKANTEKLHAELMPVVQAAAGQLAEIHKAIWLLAREE